MSANVERPASPEKSDSTDATDRDDSKSLLALMTHGLNEPREIDGAPIAPGCPLSLAQAARAASTPLQHARELAATRAFQAAFDRECQALRDAERDNNAAVRATIRASKTKRKRKPATKAAQIEKIAAILNGHRRRKRWVKIVVNVLSTEG